MVLQQLSSALEKVRKKPRLLSIAQAVTYLDVTRSMYRLAYCGELAAVRAFKNWKFDRSDLDAFVVGEKIML